MLSKIAIKQSVPLLEALLENVSQDYNLDLNELKTKYLSNMPKSPSLKKTKKKTKNSAYSMFLKDKDVIVKLKEENPNASFGELSKLKGKIWKNLSNDEKQIYKIQADKVNKDNEEVNNDIEHVINDNLTTEIDNSNSKLLTNDENTVSDNETDNNLTLTPKKKSPKKKISKKNTSKVKSNVKTKIEKTKIEKTKIQKQSDDELKLNSDSELSDDSDF